MQVLTLGVLLHTLVSRTLAASNSSDTTTSSHSNVASSSTNIGDYVAAGLGLASVTTQTASSDATILSQARSTGSLASSARNESFLGNSTHANTTITGGNTVKILSTSFFSSCQSTTTNSRGQKYANCVYTTTIVTNTFTNTTWAAATDVDDCWTEWTSYWSMHKPSPATISVVTVATDATTETTPYLYTKGSYITDQTVTTTITSTAPTVADNGGFTQTLSPVVVTYTTVLTAFLSASTTSTSMYTRTWTPPVQNYTLVSASNDPNWPAPSCTLPAVYPACQSQWDDYATHNIAPNPQPLSANCEFNLLDLSQSAPACYTNIQSSWESWRSYVGEATSPVCSQASVTGSLCTSLKDAYVIGHNDNLAPQLPEPATFSSGYYSNVAPWFTGWTWPATQAFAPGCTLDCGRCAVTGGTIQLLYFPPGLTHPATEPVIATTLGTVLTSPTYYISFESLYASDACSGIGSTLTSMILPIPTSEPLSTLFATTMPCDAHRENNAWLGLIDIGTAAFNVTDLMHDPVPYSVYTSQPYCASQIAASGCDPDSCPTTLPYRPLIVLSSQLLNTLDPAWATCSLDLRGLYDPPKALTPATALVVPTLPGALATTSATPASGIASATADPTAQPEHEDPTPAHTPADSPAPASPSAKTPTSSPYSPAPVENNPSAQPSSDDPFSVLESVIAGLSNGAVSSQKSAADPVISIPEASTAHDPAAQDPVTDALGALTASPADPAGSGGAPVASPTQDGNGDPTASQGGSNDPSQAADPSNTNAAVNHSPTVFYVGSQAITATPGQPLVVAGSRLSSNAAITVSGHVYSSGSGGLIIDGTSAIALPGSGRQGSAAVVTIGSQILTASAADKDHSSVLVIAGTTLTPGGSAATIDGTVVSAGSSGLVVGGTQTIPLSNVEPGSTDSTWQTLLTLGSSTLTAVLPLGTGGAVVVDGTTLSLGGPAMTIDGTEVSAGTAGIVIGGTSTASFKATGDSSRTASRSASSTAGSSTAADPDSATSTAQSGGQRAFDALVCWIYAVSASCIALGAALI